MTFHLCVEAISSPAQGLDILPAVWFRAESFSEDVEILRKIGFLDDRIVPNLIYQFVFAEYRSAVFYEDGERFDDLRSKCYFRSVPVKHQLFRIELEPIERIHPIFTAFGHRE